MKNISSQKIKLKSAKNVLNNLFSVGTNLIRENANYLLSKINLFYHFIEKFNCTYYRL